MIALAALAMAAAPAADSDPRVGPVLQAIRSSLGAEGFANGARVAVGFADLGGDQREEAVVHLVDRNLCGSGGCMTIVLTPSGKGWRRIGRISVTNLPIYLLPSRRNGWRELGITVGGGGQPGGVAAVPYANGRYAYNPTVSPARPVAADGASMLIATTYDQMIPVSAP